MGLFSRASDVLGSKAAAILESQEDPAEAIDLVREQLRDERSTVENRLTDFVTQKKRLEATREEVEDEISTYNSRAREAVVDGREDDARSILEAKHRRVARLDELTDRIAEFEDIQAELIEKRNELRSRIDAFESEAEVLKARLTAQTAQETIDRTGFTNEITTVLDRVAEQTEEETARARAMEELRSAGVFDESDSIDDELESTREADAIDDELDAIKRGDIGDHGERDTTGDTGDDRD
ncbi:PspA/IM30 family protein [Halalkalirubrum salinum]|uniref:PspA/IM30 family protein n=1 Tax=Halalkalirubrum salinum TaxID=2563889 RepID=UPI0010FB273B|nr:PspA/IM30 family protein [Halalkalirubrum salinum]